jgi:hypothetical protein
MSDNDISGKSKMAAGKLEKMEVRVTWPKK